MAKRRSKSKVELKAGRKWKKVQLKLEKQQTKQQYWQRSTRGDSDVLRLSCLSQHTVLLM